MSSRRPARLNGMHLSTTLEPRGPAAAIVLSDAQRHELAGDRKTAPVSVTVNGHTVALRMTTMRGETLIGFSRAVRAECEVEPGDAIEAEVVVDDTPREVPVPDDLAAVLDAQPGVRSAFDTLSNTRRKELVRAIVDAKRPETREKRIAAAVEAASDRVS